MLSCKFCETFNNAFLTKHLRSTPTTPNFQPTQLTSFFWPTQKLHRPRHLRQNLDPRYPHQFFNPRLNFMDPRHPRQMLTSPPTPPTLPILPTQSTPFSRLTLMTYENFDHDHFRLSLNFLKFFLKIWFNLIKLSVFCFISFFVSFAFTDGKPREMLDFIHLLYAQSCTFLYIIN